MRTNQHTFTLKLTSEFQWPAGVTPTPTRGPQATSTNAEPTLLRLVIIPESKL